MLMPFLHQAISSIFPFLQSADAIHNLLLFGNLLYMPAAKTWIYMAQDRSAFVPQLESSFFLRIPSSSSFLNQVWISKPCSTFPSTMFPLNSFQFNLTLPVTLACWIFWFFSNFISAHSHSFYLNYSSACPFFLIYQHFFSSRKYGTICVFH